MQYQHHEISFLEAGGKPGGLGLEKAHELASTLPPREQAHCFISPEKNEAACLHLREYEWNFTHMKGEAAKYKFAYVC